MPYDFEALRRQQFRERYGGGDVARGTDPLQDALYDPLKDHQLGKMGRAKRSIGTKLAAGGEQGWAKKIGAGGWMSRKGAAMQDSAKEKAREAMKGLTVSQVLRSYRELFMTFLEKELNSENLEFLDALDAGMDRDTIVETFIKPDSKKQINVSYTSRKRVLEGADPETLRLEVTRLLADPLPRFKKDPDAIAAVAKMV